MIGVNADGVPSDVLRGACLPTGRRSADLREVGGDNSGEGRVSALTESPTDENENCCGEAEVTVAAVFLKSAY